jgi:hypothetical protein
MFTAGEDLNGDLSGELNGDLSGDLKADLNRDWEGILKRRCKRILKRRLAGAGVRGTENHTGGDVHGGNKESGEGARAE